MSRVDELPSNAPQGMGEDIDYLGIDFSLYPHVQPHHRKLLAQRLFLSLGVDPYDAKFFVLPNPILSKAVISIFSPSDFSLEINAGYLPQREVISSTALDYYVDDVDDVDVEDEDDEDDEDEDDEDDWFDESPQDEDFPNDDEEQFYLSNGFENMYKILLKLYFWQDLFALPKEDHLRETLKNSDFDLSNLVAMRYTGFPVSSRLLKGYSLTARELEGFLTTHSKRLEPLMDTYLDEYQRLKRVKLPDGQGA